MPRDTHTNTRTREVAAAEKAEIRVSNSMMYRALKDYIAPWRSGLHFINSQDAKESASEARIIPRRGGASNNYRLLFSTFSERSRGIAYR